MSDVIGYVEDLETGARFPYVGMDENGYEILVPHGEDYEMEFVNNKQYVEINRISPLTERKETYREKASKIGALVDEKNKAYGDSFNKSGDFLKILYPDGIQPEQYKDALALVRVFDKQMRIANGNQGNENAWADICGYSILSLERGGGI